MGPTRIRRAHHGQGPARALPLLLLCSAAAGCGRPSGVTGQGAAPGQAAPGQASPGGASAAAPLRLNMGHIDILERQLPPVRPFARPAPKVTYKQKYRLDEDWFSGRLPEWVVEPYKGKAGVSYLEIGLFQGGSALWMLENVLTHPGARLTGIDVFSGKLKEIFFANLELSGQAPKATVLNEPSRTALPKLSGQRFDIIYVDGSHYAPDALADAVLCWPLLKEGGVMVIDDYRFSGVTSRGQLMLPDECRATLAIEAFVTAHRNELEVIHRDYSVIVRKKANPCTSDRASSCTPIGQYLYDWDTRRLFTAGFAQQVPLQGDELLLMEWLARSRRFGEAAFRPPPALRDHPAFVTLRQRLQLQL